MNHSSAHKSTPTSARMFVLLASLATVLAATCLLTLVWEISINDRSARPLYPLRFVLILCSAEMAVGLVLGILEMLRRLSFSVRAYPIVAVLYVAAWWGFTELVAPDYAFGLGNPRSQTSFSRAERF